MRIVDEQPKPARLPTPIESPMPTLQEGKPPFDWLNNFFNGGNWQHSGYYITERSGKFWAWNQWTLHQSNTLKNLYAALDD